MKINRDGWFYWLFFEKLNWDEVVVYTNKDLMFVVVCGIAELLFLAPFHLVLYPFKRLKSCISRWSSGRVEFYYPEDNLEKK